MLPPRLRGGRGGVRERSEQGKKEPHPALPKPGRDGDCTLASAPRTAYIGAMASDDFKPSPEKPSPEPARRISFVSLGCPKALVDSERIITRLRAEGYELARAHDGADLVIVNTCGFLDSAQAESLDAIGAALRENGKVIVTGCMGAEPEKITERFPNVLAITGPQQYESVLEAVHRGRAAASTIPSSISCRPRASSSRRAIMRI